ncbi:transducin family protein / WD-40 repeat family protein [Striga asiatica]|uniref:Transducin family protein / WD-40 repeat family protein n=1 Tax=Striga asiatica TaxID=4170 RepID=A0A5A7QW50_STRAF|nr:transducin family protein / WD-40 repeat family protein [Striga asiatica]
MCSGLTQARFWLGRSSSVASQWLRPSPRIAPGAPGAAACLGPALDLVAGSSRALRHGHGLRLLDKSLKRLPLYSHGPKRAVLAARAAKRRPTGVPLQTGRTAVEFSSPAELRVDSRLKFLLVCSMKG